MSFILLKSHDKDRNIDIERVINLEHISCASMIGDDLVLGFDDGGEPLILDSKEPSAQVLWQRLKSRCENYAREPYATETSR